MNFPKAEAEKLNELAAKLRRYADDIESEGRTHAPRVMREAASELERLQKSEEA